MQPLFHFGTKAETLDRLQGVVKEAAIPRLDYFSAEAWSASPETVLESIEDRFGDAMLAVRSSALIEDGAEHSMAGAFQSKLKVRGGDKVALRQAIDQVFASLTGDPRDQVLIQLMADDIEVSGVIMTFDMVHGAPYYCIDYDDESGRTDIVTGGNGINKGLFIYRYADDSLIRSPRVTRFLRLARELEALMECAALDIEFGMSRSGELFLFQVRRIALARNWHPVTERRVKRQLAFVETFVRDRSLKRDGVLGERTILAVMPDWNPAEIIGTTPHQLAASLYMELITNSVWSDARAAMGYRPVGDPELMVLINGHPYIDVRNSFNSFLPAGLPDALGAKLVDAWLNRLEAHPELHDKVEFEIVPTCLDFCFLEDFTARYPEIPDDQEFDEFRSALTAVTRTCLTPGPDSTLHRALADSTALEQSFLSTVPGGGGHAHLTRASELVRRCKKLGTLPFAIVARHAFIAEALLRSAVRRGALTGSRVADFKRTIRTVLSSMVSEYSLVCRAELAPSEFLARYGHLRPGTYEVTSLRYDERRDLFVDDMPAVSLADAPDFVLSEDERVKLDGLLEASGLDVLTADQFLQYARDAIGGREQVKFTFTRSLSDALSALVLWGQAHGLSRDDLSYLEWPTVVKSLTQPVMDDTDRHYLDLADAGRRSIAAADVFRVGHIICGVPDIYVATLNRSMPNFIGLGSAAGQVIELTADTAMAAGIKDRIVCIENADPGFDWVFTKGPKALITKFGGANSHMAIRCAELGLPAAIGCGQQIYARLVAAGSVELNCSAKILRPVHAQ